MPEYYIGLMSGTSMDSIDAALVDFDNATSSDGTTPKLINSHSKLWPDHVYDELLAARRLADDDLTQLQSLDETAGKIFADATNELLTKAGIAANEIVAIGSHGQTIRHRPDISRPFSLQLGKAEVIAHNTGINVISDFRTADIEAGGQGAPLAPAFHAAVFQSDEEHRTILNIGGIANLTLLPANIDETVTGFDCGPGNTLMDAWMRQTLNQPYDKDGTFARSGVINTHLLTSMLNDAYFKKSPPKSTGFEDFNLDWLHSHLQAQAPMQNADMLATLCELSARSITDSIKRYARSTKRVLICGGGVHNNFLIERIQQLLNDKVVESTQALGISPDWVEAIAFAWLARQTQLKLPGNLPSVTGARKAVTLGTMVSAG